MQYDAASGRLYVLHGDGDARIYVYDAPSGSGMDPTEVYGPPAGSVFHWPRGLTLDPFAADTLWITDTDNSRLLQYVNGVPTRVLAKGDFTTTGCIGGLLGDGAIYPQVCGPHGTLGIDRDGSIYAGDQQKQHVERFPAPIPLPQPSGVTRSPDARFWYAGNGQADHLHINRVGAAGLANPGGLSSGQPYAFQVQSPLLCSGQCHPQGTSNCDAGCAEYCDPTGCAVHTAYKPCWLAQGCRWDACSETCESDGSTKAFPLPCLRSMD